MQNQISQNWREATLGKLLGPKGYIRGPFGSSLRRGELLASGIPVYEQQNAINNTRDFRFYINEIKFNQLKRFAVRPNDLVVSCSGTFGKVTIIRENDPMGIISQALLILRPDTDQVLPKYLYYFLTSSRGINAIASRSTGSALINIAKRDVIEGIKLYVPEVPVQIKIIDILSKLDDKIELNNKIAKTLEEMGQMIFNKTFSVSEGRECSFSELANYVNGGAFGKISNKEGRGIPLIKIADLNRGVSDITEFVNNAVQEKYYIQDGDLLFSWSGSLGLYIWTNGKAVLNQHIFNVIPKGNFTKGFLYFALNWKLRYFKQIAGSKATTMGHIKKEHLEEQKVNIPDSVNLDIFDTIYQKLAQLKLENQKLADMRNLLLPKLMKGEIRV